MALLFTTWNLLNHYRNDQVLMRFESVFHFYLDNHLKVRESWASTSP